MRQLLICIALMFSLTSCKAQDTLALKRGYTVGYVVEITEIGTTINAGGKSMIAKNVITRGEILEVDTEYDLVYDIIDRRGQTTIINLIGAEYSARESAKRRAKLLQLLE